MLPLLNSFSFFVLSGQPSSKRNISANGKLTMMQGSRFLYIYIYILEFVIWYSWCKIVSLGTSFFLPRSDVMVLISF